LVALILAWPLVRPGGERTVTRERPEPAAEPVTPHAVAAGGGAADGGRVAAGGEAVPASSKPVPASRTPSPRPRADVASAPGAGAAPASAPVEQKTGIAVFPAPGTDPPKAGLVVPDGFELPPGYVRHYQTTDDGKQLPPILMFHPDFHPVDEHGEPIPLPEDRVVPPELAPPGMPRDVLEVPPTNVPFVEDPPR
jgi:hypothetical protein